MESKIPYEKQTDTDPPPQYEPPTAPAAMDTTTAPSVQRVEMVYLRTIPGPVFGPKAVRTICPSCQSSIVSNIKYECTSRTYMLDVIACCCCVPYLMNSCKSANHMCPNCDAFLGRYIN